MLKSTVLAVVITLLGTNLAFARQKGPHQGKNFDEGSYQEQTEKRLNRMEKKLDLTKDQKEKIRSILESKKEEKMALHKKAAALREETHKEIQAVLTTEQQVKLDKKMKKGMKKRHKKSGNTPD